MSNYEYEDFASWMKLTAPGRGDDFYRVNGAGEMLVFPAADFEDFRERDPICRPLSRRSQARGDAACSWFSNEEGKKGAIAPGQLADLAVLSDDFFSAREENIQHLESVLTVVGGKPVYATAEFKDLDSPPLPISPDWSPVRSYGGYGAPLRALGMGCGARSRRTLRRHGAGAQIDEPRDDLERDLHPRHDRESLSSVIDDGGAKSRHLSPTF